MGTPVRRDALTPNDLQYYAPRKLRDGDPPSIQPSPATDEPQNLHTSGDSVSKDSAPLSDIFHSSHENSDQVAHRPRRAGHPRLKALAMVAGAAVVGVLVGIAVPDAIQGQGEPPPPAKVPDVPLATRLQTAASDLQKTSQPVVLPQLTLSDSIGDANVPLKLGVEVKNYTADATVDLSGLPAGTVLSTGSARGDGQWRIIVDDLPKTRVTPPRDYVGLMTLTAEVRGNGQAIVRGPVRLTWRQIPTTPDTVGVRTPNAGLPVAANVATPKIEPPVAPKTIETPAAPAKTEAAVAPRKLNASEVAALLRRGEELLANGDLAAARLLLQRVAETKNAQAAFQLASTYDPAALKKFSNNSVAADPALAQYWYERARDWGSPDASSPLEALASRATAK
jgi:TPR repeat protein